MRILNLLVFQILSLDIHFLLLHNYAPFGVECDLLSNVLDEFGVPTDSRLKLQQLLLIVQQFIFVFQNQFIQGVLRLINFVEAEDSGFD